MWKNIKFKLYHLLALAPQTLTATTATAGVDTKDLNALAFNINLGAMVFDGTNFLTVNLQHSDTDSAYANVIQENLYEGTAPAVLVLNDTAQQSKSHLVEYRGGKRFVRLNIVESGTVSVPISVVAISTKPELMPPQ